MCVYENSTSFFSSYSYLNFLTLKQSQRLKHFLKSEVNKKTVGGGLHGVSRGEASAVTLHTEILFLGLKVMNCWQCLHGLKQCLLSGAGSFFNWSAGEVFMLFNPVGQTRFSALCWICLASGGGRLGISRFVLNTGSLLQCWHSSCWI